MDGITATPKPEEDAEKPAEEPKADEPKDEKPAEEPVPAPDEAKPALPSDNVAVAAVAATAPADPKTPTTPATHPRPVGHKDSLLIGLGVVLLLAVAAGAYFFANGGKLGLTGQTEVVAVVTSPNTPSVLPAQTEATPEPTTVDPARDAKRQEILAAYAQAFRATAKAGYYHVTPPAVSYTAADPTTQQAYVVSAAAPIDLGMVQYHAGGRCGLSDMTPGKTATKYVSLSLRLEGDATPACVNL